MLADRPNERKDEDREPRTGAARTPLADGNGDIEPTTSRPSIRWVQLAYDLEQYGDPDPDERGEVF